MTAIAGASQYHILSVQGHSNASTSEVKTKDVARVSLAGQAMQNLEEMEW